MNTGVHFLRKKMQNNLLSIITPSYNEKNNIENILKEYAKFKKYNFELIFVNNGSTDGTEKILAKFSKNENYKFLKIINVKKNIGYGHGIMTGVKEAKGELISWTHADLQTPPKDVFKAYEQYKKYDNKKYLIKGIRKGRKTSDSIISMSMAVIASAFLKMQLSEINAQPKLFHRDLKKYLSNYPNDFTLDLFLLYRAKKNGFKIKNIEVNFLKRVHGKSKWAYSFSSKLKTILKTFNYIIKLSRSN